MLNIDGNQNITLTRGDTLTMTVTLLHEVEPVPPATEPTIEPYVPEQDDRYQYIIDVYKAPKEAMSLDGWITNSLVNHIIDCVNSSTHKLT